MSISGVIAFNNSTKMEACRGKSFQMYDNDLCESLKNALTNVYQGNYTDAYKHFEKGINDYIQTLNCNNFSIDNIINKFLPNMTVAELICFEVILRTGEYPKNFISLFIPFNLYMSKAYYWLQKNPKTTDKVKHTFLISYIKNFDFLIRLDFDNDFLEIICEDMLSVYNELTDTLKKQLSGIKDSMFTTLIQVAFTNQKYDVAFSYLNQIGESSIISCEVTYLLAEYYYKRKEYECAYACASHSLIRINSFPKIMSHTTDPSVTKVNQNGYNEVLKFKPHLEVIRRESYKCQKKILSDFLMEKQRVFSISTQSNQLEITTDIYGCNNSLQQILDLEGSQCTLSFNKNSIVINKFDRLKLVTLKRIIEFVDIKENQGKRAISIPNNPTQPVISGRQNNIHVDQLTEMLSKIEVSCTSTEHQKKVKQDAEQIIQKQILKKQKKNQKTINNVGAEQLSIDPLENTVIESDAKLLGFSPEFGNGKFHLCRKYTNTANVYVVCGDNLSGEVPLEPDLSQFEALFENAVIVPKRGKSGFKWMKNPKNVEPAIYLVGKVVTQKLRIQPTFYQKNSKGDIAFYYGKFVNTKNGVWKKNYIENGTPIRKIR